MNIKQMIISSLQKQGQQIQEEKTVDGKDFHLIVGNMIHIQKHSSSKMIVLQYAVRLHEQHENVISKLTPSQKQLFWDKIGKLFSNYNNTEIKFEFLKDKNSVSTGEIVQYVTKFIDFEYNFTLNEFLVGYRDAVDIPNQISNVIVRGLESMKKSGEEMAFIKTLDEVGLGDSIDIDPKKAIIGGFEYIGKKVTEGEKISNEDFHLKIEPGISIFHILSPLMTVIQFRMELGKERQTVLEKCSAEHIGFFKRSVEQFIDNYGLESSDICLTHPRFDDGNETEIKESVVKFRKVVTYKKNFDVDKFFTAYQDIINQPKPFFNTIDEAIETILESS